VSRKHAEAIEDLEGFIQVGKLEFQQGHADSSHSESAL
jgi:hypothetical protein